MSDTFFALANPADSAIIIISHQKGLESMEYKVIDISEEDYGCEGIPEDSELMCSVLIESSDGTQKWLKIADRYLRENDIDIGSVITAD